MQTKSVWFFVWRENGIGPTYQHSTMDSARAEAERLGRLNPGVRFYVGEVAGFCVVMPPPAVWTALLPEVPF